MARRTPAQRETFVEILQGGIRASGMSLYAISKATGLSASILSRFMAGVTMLRLDHADALARFLGLELRPAKKKGTR